MKKTSSPGTILLFILTSLNGLFMLFVGLHSLRVILRPSLFTDVQLILFILSCISLLNTVDLKDTLRGGIFRLLQYILFYFAVFSGCRDRKHFTRISASAVIGLILVCVDALWQINL
jgi:hypothetical protein